jgi:signal peptidase II
VRTIGEVRRDDRNALIVAAVVLVVDQLSKAAVVAGIPRGDRVRVIPDVLELVHVRNPGIAGGRLADAGTPVVVLVSVVALTGVLLLLRRSGIRRGLWLPIGLLLGGGIGNLVDRLRTGAVTDFLQLGGGDGAANLADQAIVLGIVVLIVLILLPERRREPAAETPEVP